MPPGARRNKLPWGMGEQFPGPLNFEPTRESSTVWPLCLSNVNHLGILYNFHVGLFSFPSTHFSQYCIAKHNSLIRIIYYCAVHFLFSLYTHFFLNIAEIVKHTVPFLTLFPLNVTER